MYMPKRVVVLLNDQEYEKVKEAAGAVPLSAWFRLLAEKHIYDWEANHQPCKHGLLFCKTCK